MLQKPHDRVQTSPRIISVAVPALQHSPMFGALGALADGVEFLIVDETDEARVGLAGGHFSS